MNPGEEFLVKGKRCYSLGDYDGAIRACEVALHQQHGCLDAYLLRGKAFYKKEFFGPSIRDFRIVLKSAPCNEEARKLLAKAENLKHRIIEESKTLKEIHGFQVMKFLGSGWEGSIYLVRDINGKKNILKKFHEHRVEKLNSKTIPFYQIPVAGGAVHLQRLAECSQCHSSAYIYPFTLLRRGSVIVGLVYDFEPLITIDHRYIASTDLKLSLLKAFFEIQKFLLLHLDLVMVDASIGQFMITRSGRLRFIDYGESINPIDDFRSKQEHWHILSLIKLLYQLFKPGMEVHFKPPDFGVLKDPEKGFGNIIVLYPFIAGVIDELQKPDLTAFSDYSFYAIQGTSLPERLGLASLSKIHMHHFLSQLKQMVTIR
jgi:tetratricopeptide (TPR) repeat protein